MIHPKFFSNADNISYIYEVKIYRKYTGSNVAKIFMIVKVSEVR